MPPHIATFTLYQSHSSPTSPTIYMCGGSFAHRQTISILCEASFTHIQNTVECAAFKHDRLPESLAALLVTEVKKAVTGVQA